MNRLLVGVLCCVLLLAGIASAQSPPTVQRLWGSTKFDTNVEVLRATYPDGADRLTVVTGDNYPDALSALNVDGALLLVPTCGELPASTAALLDSWPPPVSVTILGGPGAICEAMVDQVTTRWSGTDPQPTSTPTIEPTPEPTADPNPLPTSATYNEAWQTEDRNTIEQWHQVNAGYDGLWSELTTHNGSLNTTQDGQVIDGMLVRGTISVLHDDVTIRNSVVDRDATHYGILADFSSAPQGLRIEGVTVDGYGCGGSVTCETGIMVNAARGAVITDVDVRGWSGGIRFAAGQQIRHAYIHDIVLHDNSHNTAMSMRGGSDTLVTESWLEGSTSSAIAYYSDAAVTDALLTRSVLEGGAYEYGGPDNKAAGGQCRNVDVVDVLFTDDYVFGPVKNPCQDAQSEFVNARLFDGTPVR